MFARFFNLFIETPGQKSSQPEKQEVKPGSQNLSNRISADGTYSALL